MTNVDVNLINGIALAFEGDAVYSLYIRRHLIFQGQTKPNQSFHNSSLTCDVACGQYQPTKKRYKTIKQPCYNPLYVKQCKQERVDLQRSVESPLN